MRIIVLKRKKRHAFWEASLWKTVSSCSFIYSCNNICALIFWCLAPPPPSCTLGALYAKLIYPNISTTSQQPLLFNINNFVNGNLLIHKRLRRRRCLLGGSSHMNVKNPQIDEGHLQKRHKVWLIITASFVCVYV